MDPKLRPDRGRTRHTRQTVTFRTVRAAHVRLAPDAHLGLVVIFASSGTRGGDA